MKKLINILLFGSMMLFFSQCTTPKDYTSKAVIIRQEIQDYETVQNLRDEVVIPTNNDKVFIKETGALYYFDVGSVAVDDGLNVIVQGINRWLMVEGRSIYNIDSYLPENRTVNLDNYDLSFNNGEVNIDSSLNVESLHFDTSPTFENGEGSMYWDEVEGLPKVGLEGDLTAMWGQEPIYVRNNTGVTIPVNSSIIITGSIGNRPTIALADASSIYTSSSVGITAQEIENNSDGYIYTGGIYYNMNTSAFPSGVPLWQSEVAGELTMIRPEPPAISVLIGVSLYQHPTQGNMLLKPTTIPRFVGLSDIDDTGLAENYKPYWDAASSTFKFKALTESDISDLQSYLLVESDPIYSAWDKSTGITIIESQITDLQHTTISDGYGINLTLVGVDYEIEADTSELVTPYDLEVGNTNIGNANLTLSDDRTLDLDGYDLSFINGGNVGIGTTTPTEKLEVLGDTKLDGNLEVTGTTNLKDEVSIEANTDLNGYRVLGEPNDRGLTSYYFDGDADYISISNNNNIDLTEAISINLRFKTTDAVSTQYLLIKNLAYNMYIDLNGTSTLRLNLPGVGDGQTVIDYSFEVEKWYTVTATWDGINTSIYVNGIYSGGESATGSLAINTNILAISNVSLAFNGEISDVKLYNRALSQEEVEELYRGSAISYQDKGANQTEMVTNGDFLSGTTDWLFADCIGTVGTYQGRADVLEAKATHTSTIYPYQLNDFKVGKKYRVELTYFIPSTNTNINSIYLKVGNTASGILHVYNILDSWTTEIIEIICDDDSGNLYFYNSSGDINDIIYIDNVSVIQIGNILDLNQTSGGETTWLDQSGNNLDGTVDGATLINYRGSHSDGDTLYATTITSESDALVISGRVDQTDLGNSTYFGSLAGSTDDGTDNRNVGLGFNALQLNTVGIKNTATGYRSLVANIDGNYNSAVGYQSLRTNSSGELNIAFGYQSSYSNSVGSSNTSLGAYGLYLNSTGSNNTANGYYSLYNSLGNYNVAIGSYAGQNITTGSYNIIIGANINAPSATDDYQLNFGDVIYGDLVLGYIGVNTPTPSVELEVLGDTKLDGTLEVTGDLTAIGAQIRGTTTVTSATYTVLNTDRTIFVNYAGTVTITIPTALLSRPNALKLRFKDISGNANSSTNKITIVTEGAELIDGAATATIESGYSGFSIEDNDTNWFITNAITY